MGDGECSITFRDSLRLFGEGSSLEKLCKEFDVKHKKLTETVSHDKITIDNWHTFSELPRYLEYDCKGLFEVLQAFSLQVFESTAQDEFKGCEAYVRQLFECARGVEYKKTRPSELKLELDGFSPIMNEAFEYDGIQHTTFPNPFHKTVGEFHKLQENDRKKDAWCEEKGIALHRIPHHVKFRELPAYVSELTGVDLNDVQFDTGGKIGINMTSCFTGASLSKKSFFAKHYKQIKYPVYSLNEETDAFIRDFYRGGRVEIFHLGKVPADKLWYYDFTSLYPWCGTKNLPYGKPLWVDSFDVNKHFGFVQVRVKSKPNMVHKKPLHGLLEDGKFIFRHFKDFTPMVLFSEELQVGIKSGLYEYEIKGGYTFQSAPWMKNFFEEAFDRKAQAKKAGNNALAQVWKIIINSGYGFWGLRVKDRDTVLIQKSEKGVIYPYIKEGKFLNYNEVGEYSIMRVLSDLPVKDFNVGVASAISSYARCRLWSLINDIESKGKSVYMCDTDSIITNIKINDHPDLMREYMWDGCGDELGSLKNEADDFIKDKDEIKRLKEEEGNMICFNECILGGCKFYALRKNGIDKTICKCKGYKKSKGEELTFKDFEEMAGGGVKSQRQVQFLCPKMNHVSMTERFSMRTPQVLKKFKFDYNKGVVHDDGKITPIYA